MTTLFTPFKQAQRLAGGTGLGLYSLAKRMEAINGYYGVQKRRDGLQGSLFWFAFPYKPDTMTAAMNPLEMVNALEEGAEEEEAEEEWLESSSRETSSPETATSSATC